MVFYVHNFRLTRDAQCPTMIQRPGQDAPKKGSTGSGNAGIASMDVKWAFWSMFLPRQMTNILPSTESRMTAPATYIQKNSSQTAASKNCWKKLEGLFTKENACPSLCCKQRITDATWHNMFFNSCSPRLPFTCVFLLTHLLHLTQLASLTSLNSSRYTHLTRLTSLNLSPSTQQVTSFNSPNSPHLTRLISHHEDISRASPFTSATVDFVVNVGSVKPHFFCSSGSDLSTCSSLLQTRLTSGDRSTTTVQRKGWDKWSSILLYQSGKIRKPQNVSATLNFLFPLRARTTGKSQSPRKIANDKKKRLYKTKSPN